MELRVTVFDNGKVVGQKQGIGHDVILSLKNVKRWSPSSPFLYDLEVNLFGRKWFCSR
jgi:beta-galactosidase/beta-glucuronidase